METRSYSLVGTIPGMDDVYPRSLFAPPQLCNLQRIASFGIIFLKRIFSVCSLQFRGIDKSCLPIYKTLLYYVVHYWYGWHSPVVTSNRYVEIKNLYIFSGQMELLQVADKNGDGKMSYEEFLELMTENLVSKKNRAVWLKE